MSARSDTLEILNRLQARGISLSFDEVNTLRRAEIVLQRWAEGECGDSNDYSSRCIVRDDEGKPYMEVIPHQSNAKARRWRIPDREAGALRRVSAICKAHGLYFFHQTDPRGCALYVSNEPLTDSDYSRGVSCCA